MAARSNHRWSGDKGSNVMSSTVRDQKPTQWWLIGGLTIPCYAALASLVINLVITVAFTWLFNLVRSKPGRDATVAVDYQEAVL